MGFISAGVVGRDANRSLPDLPGIRYRDAEAVVDNVTDDFTNEHAVKSSGCTGRTIRGVPRFLLSMPGLYYDVEDVVADGDRVVAYTMHVTVSERDVAVRGDALLCS